MRIEVLTPGLLSTVQDAGRYGHAALGVGVSGAVDAYSHAVANLLVGNAGDCASLELTLTGPRLRFEQPARIALCGAGIDASVGGSQLPGWRRIELPAGCELRLGACRDGCRTYLAVAGGIAVAPVLGSRATDLRGGFGGFHGRALRAGDVLQVGEAAAPTPQPVNPDASSWWLDPRPDLVSGQPARVGLLPGDQAATPPEALFSHAWTVSNASDRQGLRLDGPALAINPRHLPSEPVLPGTVQLPPDGQPIVLLADAQTIGGYPRIGHVPRWQLPRLAQLRPGEQLRFQPCGVEEALRGLRAQQQRLARMRLAVEARCSR